MLQRGCADERTDAQRSAVAAVLLEDVEPGNPIDVNEQCGRGKPQLHQQDEALPAGEDLGIVAMLCQEGQRLVQRPRSCVLETGREHEPPPRIAQPTLKSETGSG